MEGGKLMKVVIPVGALHIGGGCKVLAEVANALAARGHETEIVIPEGAVVEYDVYCKLTRIPSLSKEHIPYGDIVLPNFYTTFKPAYEAWPEQCVRLSLGFEPYWVPDKDFAIWTYAQGVPTISISHWLDDQIYNHVGQRGLVINLGVDPGVFHPAVKKHPLYKDGRKVILYIARNPNSAYKLKGYDDFLSSMRLVKKHYNGNFIVHMICTEVPLPLPGIPVRVFRPETTEIVARLYRTSDLFVSTSWFEGFAIPPLESMASGTPVVTTNSGGVLDFCEHMKSAYISTPKDPRSIAKGIYAVLTRPKLANQLILGGRQSAARLTKLHFENNIVTALQNIHQQRLNK
jgi:glycosyltransferase involved in cell wall biosynthesis